MKVRKDSLILLTSMCPKTHLQYSHGYCRFRDPLSSCLLVCLLVIDHFLFVLYYAGRLPYVNRFDDYVRFGIYLEF